MQKKGFTKAVVDVEDSDDDKIQVNSGELANIDEEDQDNRIVLTSKDITLSKRLINRMIQAVEDANSESRLTEVLEQSFGIIMHLINSVQSVTSIKTLKGLATSILKNIKDLAHDEGLSQKVFDQTIELLVSSLAQVEGASEHATLKLTYSGALALNTFTLELLSAKNSFPAKRSPALARALISVTNFLTENQDTFNKKTLQVYTFLSKQTGFNVELFQQAVIDKIGNNLKFTYLTYLSEASKDLKGYAFIGKKFCDYILNDKLTTQYVNIAYFIPYLNRIDEETFKSQVYPEIEFMMKRGPTLIPLITKTLGALSFTITPDIITLLTSAILTDDFLVKDELLADAREYFGVLSSKLTTKESFNSLIMDYLFKRFTTSRNSSLNSAQRLVFFRHISFALKSLKNASLIESEQVNTLLSALLDHFFQQKEEITLKDSYDDIVHLFTYATSVTLLHESLKKLIGKASNIYHINLFSDLMDRGVMGVLDLLPTLAPQFKTMLQSENFKTSMNFSTILALVGFFCSAFDYSGDASNLTWMINNENILTYLATTRGFINTDGYFTKNPTRSDVQHHTRAITQLIVYHYKEQQLVTGDNQLRNMLCEYIFNEQDTMREHYILQAIEDITKKVPDDQFSGNFLSSFFNKAKEVSVRPPSYNREDGPHKTSVSRSRMVQLTLKYTLKLRKTDLNEDEFVKIVKTICHPFISATHKQLMKQITTLAKILPEGKLPSYFEAHGKVLQDYAIRQRTGILSHNKTLRAAAINIGVALASQNQLPLFINDLAKVLNYKPLEMAQKLEKIFVQEFEKISFYDMLFYSEITKDLLNVFTERDNEIIKREVMNQINSDGSTTATASQENGTAEVEEEKSEEPAGQVIDPSKLAAMMLKQQAALKKAALANKKPGSTAVAKPAPAKPQAAKKPQQKEEAAPVDKELRRSQDRQQIITYMHEISRIKGEQITAALEIVKRANINSLQLDLTLNYLLMPMIKLLNYPPSRFSTNICLQNLFGLHRLEPLFPVRNEVVSCLNALSAQRIYIKNMREFQQIFQHIEQNTQVQYFDKGYIQMIMMMANSVLKDLSVHLSVKEQALAVVQSILESSNLVENIDLVIVTINMMKSSYNNQNLSQYLNLLLRRLNLEQLALILQRIFEYEPVPRMILLKELLEYEMPLCCPVWFSTQVWVLQFDEECSKVARKLWNKYSMVLRSGAIDLSQEVESKNMFYYMRSKNTNIFDNTIRATIAAIEIFQNRYDLIIDDLIQFYNMEVAIIDKETLEASMAADSQSYQGSSQNIISDERLNRVAVAEVIKRTAHLVSSNSFKKIFDFFIVQGCLDQNEQVSTTCMEAALQVITVKGSDYAEEILKILEKYINEKQKYSEQSKNQAIIMIGALANFLDNTSQKKLVGTFEKMLELLNTPSELIRQSICKVIPQLARFFDAQSKKFLEDHMKILKESQDEKLLRGSAYAVSGIIKGLGMQAFLQMDLIASVKKDCFTKHADPLRKVSGLYLYETLTISLGKVFEMYIEKILPDIMQCIADPKEQVRRAALQANRTIMSKLSNHAIKQVLPIFLNGLYLDNWRSKLASVEALGNTAFCAPRQIASFLPQIVKGIREVLTDTHEKVHEAALQAIKNIGSVIKCPEIADILETLVKALSNPNIYLKDAMKVLLDTSFVHAIDAPSLSLLIPILDSGLMMHDNESKHLASKLMGNICNLTQDPEDLLPYIKILMPAIKNSLFDSIPEIRASAAKALGSLSRGLGLANSVEILQWLHQVLDSKILHSSERMGAAQGFAEILSVHGVKFFEDKIKETVIMSQDSQPHIRESYRSVMVFLATCYENFVTYLPKLLPIMIQGLSDDVEEVRKISLRNVKICIKLFGKIAPNQLTHPIMEMMFHRDFRVRQSSSVLMYQLVKELENDVIKLQPKYITQEVKNDILSCMFILKYDIIERVATQASQIWKNIIDNQLKVLKTIIHVLIKQIFDIIQSDFLELQEMGLNCMRGIVEKFGEKFVSETLDIIEVYMERATTMKESIALTKVIYNMVYASPTKLLTDMRVRFLTIVDSNIFHENDEIRSVTAKIFITVLQKTFEPNFMTQTLDKQFLKKLHTFVQSGQTKEADLLISTLKDILRDQPQELKLEDKIIRLCNHSDLQHTKLTIAQSKFLATVATKIAVFMFKKKNCTAVIDRLMSELTVDEIDDEKRINEVLVTFSEVLSQAPEVLLVMINEQIISEFHSQCTKKNRLGLYVDFIAYYCQHAQVNYEKFAKMYLENVLILMNDANEVLIEKVVKSFSAVINGLQKENQFTLIPLIKECLETIAVTKVQVGDHTLYKKKLATIKILEKAEGVKNLSAVIQNSITHGSIDIRIDSAICFQYLIDFSKPEAIKTEVIKICGALIRVVNDKFPPTLKLQIFRALKLILLRASLFAKAMAPQLQTTFLKAFNDNQATPLVRKEVVDCLIHFLKIAPKVDPILKELSIMIEGDKLEDNAKVEVAEILAIIIKSNGKTVQPALLTQIQTTLMNILKSKVGNYNDKTIVNCSVALSFLSNYTSDNAQLISLFDQFDNTLIINISIALKFGILLNGNETLPREKLLANLADHLKDSLKDQTGLLEIDGTRTDDADEGEEPGRLHGSFEILGHIGDTFVRRYTQSGTDEVAVTLFRAINQSGIFSRLNVQTHVCKQTMYQVLFFLSSLPVHEPHSSELQQIITDGMSFINIFYLEFENKRDAQPSVLNLLMLNYDNFMNCNDESKIQEMNEQTVKVVVNGDKYKSLMPENIRMLAVELAFIL